MATVTAIDANTVRIVASVGSGDSEANAAELGDELVAAGFATEDLTTPDIISYTSVSSGGRKTIEIGDGVTETWVQNTKIFRHYGGPSPSNSSYSTSIRNLQINDNATFINGIENAVGSNTLYNLGKGEFISLNESTAQYFHDTHSIIYIRSGTFISRGGSLLAPNVGSWIVFAAFTGSSVQFFGKNRLLNIRFAGFKPSDLVISGDLLFEGQSNISFGENWPNSNSSRTSGGPDQSLRFDGFDFRGSAGVDNINWTSSVEQVFRNPFFGGVSIDGASQTYARNGSILYFDNPNVTDFGDGEVEPLYGTFRSYNDGYERQSVYLDFTGFIGTDLLPIAKIFDNTTSTTYANGQPIIDKKIQTSGILGDAVINAPLAKDNREPGEILLIRNVINENATNVKLAATTLARHPYSCYFSAPFCEPQTLTLVFTQLGVVRRTIQLSENTFISSPTTLTHWNEIGTLINISIDFTSQFISVSGSTGVNSSGDDIQDAYDYQYYIQHEITANRDKSIFLTTADGINFSVANYDSTGRIPVSTKRLTISGTWTTGQDGDYSALQWSISSASTVGLVAGTYDLSSFAFANGSTLSLDSGSATVIVSNDPGIVTTGGGTITIVEPVIAVTVALRASSRLKIYETGTKTLVDGVNSSGTSFVWESGSAGSGYDIYIVNPGRESVFRKNFVYPSASQTLDVDQPIDINYRSTGGAYVLSLDGVGLGATSDIWLDASGSAIEVGMATGNNLSQPDGITFQLLYSFIIESRHTNDELMPFHNPVVAISATAGEFELRRGTTFKDTVTRNLLRSGGFAQYSIADALETEWLGASGLLNLTSAGTIYYWFGDATNPNIVNSLNAGELNQVIQIFGDTSNGNFDFRTSTEITFSIREQGENTTTYALKAEQSLTSLSPQAYSIPLTTTANPNITISDSAIDSNSDGTADIAPFDGMSVTYLTGSGFGPWANSTVYTANDVVLDAGRWYITASGGTSSGTGVGDDTGVTDWATYSGEREIDGTYRAFNIVYDANNGTLEQMTAFLFWIIRQNVDIDTGPTNRTGLAASPIAITQGETILMTTGAVVDNFNPSAQLTHIPVDVNGIERPYPAPPNQIVISGIPDVANNILAITNLTTAATTYPALSGGGATVELDVGTNYKFSADAPGYLRQSVTLPGNTPTFTFNLDNFRSLYDSGTNQSSDIAFNYGTLEVTISDGTANLSFADVFRTIEDYLSTSQGVLFDYPPFPVVVDAGGGNGRNYLFFPYDTTNSQVNPVRIKPDPTNTSDPTLTNFVIVLEQATAPLFDIFDFTAAGGRTIRFQTEAVAASVTVSGSGALTSQQNTWLETLFNTTTDGTGSKVFSAAALANAPSGGGGGGDATAANQTTIINRLAGIEGSGFDTATDSLEALRNRGDSGWTTATGFSTHSAADIWSVGTREVTGGTIDTNNDMRGTDNALLAASYTAPDNAGIAAIPTNPLLVNDARLDNLDAPVSGIPTNPLTALPTIPTNWITADGIAADAIAEIQNGLATPGDIPAADITAIKAKTDQLAFTVANQVDANALTGGGGDDAATIYTYFTSSSREDAFKADVSLLALEASMQSCLSAATAFTDGRFVANYSNSTATQYNADGSTRTVFDLYQADGVTPATSAQEAVERRPR